MFPDDKQRRAYMMSMLNSVHPHLYLYEDLKIWVDLRHEVEHRVFLDYDSMDSRIVEFLRIHMPGGETLPNKSSYDWGTKPQDNESEELNPLHLI